MIDDRDPRPVATDLVPLGDRLLYMQGFRIGVVAVVVLVGLFAPEVMDDNIEQAAVATLLYISGAALGELVWRLLRGRSISLFGVMLIGDGLYLAWLAYVSGGLVSPFQYLILLHLIAVALLASYRTGMKLAMWHSILLFVIWNAQEVGLLRPITTAVRDLPGSDLERLVVFTAVFWMVAVATASFSAVNERELRRRRYDLEALARLARSFESAADSRQVADALVEMVSDTFGFARTLVIGAPGGDMWLMSSRGVDAPAVSVPEPRLGSVLHAAAQQHQPVLVDRLDPVADRWLCDALPGARNVVVVPLFEEGRAIGALVAEHAMRNGSRIERRVVSMLERFASHAALALRNTWLLEDVKVRASTDGLTGIPNRRTFEVTLERELSRARRNGESLSVVMIDIDHFKELNDTRGHQAGDDVLREVASTLRRICRDFDTPARYGGEEFVVVLPRCSAEDAWRIGERFRTMLARSATGITASAGVATFPTHAEDAAGLVRAADEAMYASKRGGRDRVSLHADGEERRPALA